jgi:hypothetical protein
VNCCRILCTSLALVLAGAALQAAEPTSGPGPAAAGVQLFDTAIAPAAALPGETIAQRKDWAQIPEEKTDHRFTGAAAVVNDRLALVLRPGAPGAELYSQSPDGPVLRALLMPLGPSPGSKLATVTIAENSPGEVALDATFVEAGGKMLGLRYSLAMGQVFVRTEPKEGAVALRVAAPGRFVVLPDFFADDIAVDAREIPVGEVDLPSENFLLHLLPGGDAIRDIYEGKQQKQRRAEVEQILADVVAFVTHIRSRIEKYIEFAHEMHVYLDAQKKAHPELAPFIAEMEAAVEGIDTAVARRKGGIKDTQYVVDLVEDFRRRLLDYESDDAVEQCARITHPIVDVGYNQDELVGECRNAVKVLRQRAGLAIATNPKAAPIAGEIRDRTQKVLRNAASYEAPRH